MQSAMNYLIIVIYFFLNEQQRPRYQSQLVIYEPKLCFDIINVVTTSLYLK